jgi:ketosteroid isomerase-like protein
MCKVIQMMKNVATAVAMTMLSAMAQADAPKAAPAAAPAPTRMSAAECEVWNRELSFSRSVEAHDATAFASHLHEGTVFGAGSPAPVRGRAAVTDSWQEIIEGKKYALRWHPAFVSIGGDPNIALSSGPAWTDDFDPSTKQRYTISRFTSTWVKDRDGQWRVLFDGAGAPPKAASAEDIAKLVAAQSATCPKAS